jgi:hypothetical protein
VWLIAARSTNDTVDTTAQLSKAGWRIDWQTTTGAAELTRYVRR